MRELLLILALHPLCVFPQSTVPAPPQELDQAVMQSPPHRSSVVAISPLASDRIYADYSEEGRIAGLEGTVHLTAVLDGNGKATDVQVTKPLGLGLDEQAVEAAKQGTSGITTSGTANLDAEFILPEKGSRWHLLSVVFLLPYGASRPTFVSTTYPLGAGLVGGDAIDHAQVVAMLGSRLTVLSVSKCGRLRAASAINAALSWTSLPHLKI